MKGAKMSNFEQRLEAFQTINSLMNELAMRYTAAEMRELWDALDVMRLRYGDVFVAAAIKKDRKDAELALFRYIKTLKKEAETAPETPAEDAPAKWHRVAPKAKKKSLGKIGLLALIVLIGTAIALSIAGGAATNRSEALIWSVDRTLSGTGGVVTNDTSGSVGDH